MLCLFLCTGYTINIKEAFKMPLNKVILFYVVMGVALVYSLLKFAFGDSTESKNEGLCGLSVVSVGILVYSYFLTF